MSDHYPLPSISLSLSHTHTQTCALASRQAEAHQSIFYHTEQWSEREEAKGQLDYWEDVGGKRKAGSVCACVFMPEEMKKVLGKVENMG